MDRTTTVGQFREEVFPFLNEIVTLDKYHRFLKRTRSITQEELERIWIQNHLQVTKLVETLARLQSEPLHKLQTAFRKAPDDAQFLFVIRLSRADSQLRELPQDKEYVVPSDFAASLKMLLL